MPEVLAFLYPGQGQLPTRVVASPQTDPMYARAEAEGLALRDWISARDARLSRTDAAQPAVFLDALARTEQLTARGLRADVVAGHSLGEYAAFVTAGVLTAQVAFDLVLARGRLMADVPGGMTAVLKLREPAVDEVCRAVGRGAVIANRNGAGQFVVSAPRDVLDEVEQRVAERGGRAIRLAVSGPFHSPAMRPAERALASRIAAATLAPPACALVSSVSGASEADPAALRALLTRQMTAPVDWTAVLATLARLGVSRAAEVGCGSVLTQLGRRAGGPVRFMTFEEVLDE